MSSFGMGMIFTNSGKTPQVNRQRQAPSQVQRQVQRQKPIQRKAQARSFPPIVPVRGFRTMDLGDLKNSKSCGSCGH